MNVRMFANKLIVLMALSLAGCGTVQPLTSASLPPPVSTTEHRVETSYEIGKQAEAFVGERMLSVQDHYLVTRESGAGAVRLVPSENFTMKIPPLFISMALTTADVVTVEGTTERDGVSYRVVNLPASITSQLRFLITAEGALQGSALNLTGSRMGYTYSPIPASVRFVPAPSETHTGASKGSVNYELLYGGTDGDSFQILYREYTPEDLARPTFTQNLVYEKHLSTIRFRKLSIQVHGGVGSVFEELLSP